MDETMVRDVEYVTEMFIADTFFTKFMGYMFQKVPRYSAILLNPCNSIHTFFMKFDIDVVFVNKDMEVIRKVEGLRPRRVILPVKGAEMVIEAKAGMLASLDEGCRVIIY